MSFLNNMIELITPYIPLLITALSVGVLLWGTHWILLKRHLDLGDERKITRQLIMMGLTVASVVALALALPIDASSRNQIIGLIGLVISAIFAFSSGTVFSNLMAGLLLRTTTPFRIGDFIYVHEYFGRVTEKGLFDTEIQAENRELIAIPNIYLVSNPISTVRSSGAIVSISLSLGYDIHHSQVDSLLIKAAEKSGLKESFVQILELGNYSITYRISGVLTDVKGLLTARSELYRAVLDTLHGHGVEIMSPSFMNQRQMDENQRIIPTPIKEKTASKSPTAEKIVFDKAEQAEQLDKVKRELLDQIHQLETTLSEATELDKKQIKIHIEDDRERLRTLEQIAEKSNKET